VSMDLISLIAWESLCATVGEWTRQRMGQLGGLLMRPSVWLFARSKTLLAILTKRNMQTVKLEASGQAQTGGKAGSPEPETKQNTGEV